MPNEQQIATMERQKRVASLMLRGVTSRRDMAAAMGVPIRVIHDDCKAIKEAWRERGGITSADVEEVRMLRITQMERIMQLAHSEFDKSRQPKEEHTVKAEACGMCQGHRFMDREEEVTCPACRGTGEVLTRTTKVTERCGDPAYLNIAAKAIMECSKLEGISGNSLQLTKVQKMTQDLGGTLGQLEETTIVSGSIPMEVILRAKGLLDEIRSKQLPKLDYQDVEDVKGGVKEKGDDE